MKQYQGLAASPGIAIGEAWIFQTVEPTVVLQKISESQVAEEVDTFHAAKAKVIKHLQVIYQRVRDKQGEEEAEIFSSHIEMLQDEEFEKDILDDIEHSFSSATNAVNNYLNQAADNMRALDDPYLRERAAEFEDLNHNLLLALNDIPFASLADAPVNCVIFAKDLSPSETAQLNPDNVRGFVLEQGGLTSHVAILARNMGIPAIMGVQGILGNVTLAEKVIVNATDGKLIIDADQQNIERFLERQQELEKLQTEYAKLHDQPAISEDGFRIKLFSNIGSPQDLHLIDSNGSEGVGLFRSEFLFMESTTAPSEELQFEAYKKVVEHLAGKPVILRLADIGGDKPLPYLDFPHEENPFLGWRGVRIYEEMTAVFETQIRAALRASAFGDLWIMVPMVSNVSELIFVKDAVQAQAKLLSSQGIDCDPQVKVGIMVETPAAALIAKQLAKHADFFSIGTNDLTQYTMAVDRGNAKISHIYDSLHPAILKLMKETADAAHQAGIEVGVCGEMGGQIEAIPLLLGMGFSELSISGKTLPEIKYRIGRLNQSQCREILMQAIEKEDAEQVRELIRQFN